MPSTRNNDKKPCPVRIGDASTCIHLCNNNHSLNLVRTLSLPSVNPSADLLRHALFSPSIPSQALQYAPAEELNILSTLWDALEELDELSASTQSVLRLLSELLQHLTQARPAAIEHCHREKTPLNRLVARLWPFLRLPSSAIRQATLDALAGIVLAVTDAGLGQLLQPILCEALSHTFQALLLEEVPVIVPAVRTLWRGLLRLCTPDVLAAAARPRLVAWCSLLVTPAGRPLDRTLLLLPPATVAAQRRTGSAGRRRPNGTGGYVIGGPAQFINIDAEVVQAARLEGADALGLLAARWQEDGVKPVELYELARQLIEPNSATKRLLGGAMLATWAVAARTDYAGPNVPPLPRRLRELVATVLGRVEGVVELNDLVAKMRREATEILVTYGRAGIDADALHAVGEPVSLNRDQCVQLLERHVPAWDAALASQAYWDARRVSILALRSTVAFLAEEYERLRLAFSGTLAATLVHACDLPEKLKPVIEPLMESLKREEHWRLQERCGVALAFMLRQTASRQPPPNAKIGSMIYAVLSRDTEACPVLGQGAAALTEGIYTLHLLALEETAEVARIARTRRGGRKAGKDEEDDAMGAFAAASATASAAATDGDEDSATTTAERETARISHRGVDYALQALATEFGAELLQGMPSLLQQPYAQLTATLPPGSRELTVLALPDAQKTVTALAQLEAFAPTVPPSVRTALIEPLPHLLTAVIAEHPVVRYKASKCLAAIASLPECREPVRNGSRRGDNRGAALVCGLGGRSGACGSRVRCFVSLGRDCLAGDECLYFLLSARVLFLCCLLHVSLCKSVSSRLYACVCVFYV